MPTPTYAAEYCRSLRQLVESGTYDFYTANAMWRKYREGLLMFGVDPGPCALGPEAPPQSVIDAGGGDGGFSLAGPDAGYAVKDAGAGADPNSWSPNPRPQINLGFDTSAAGGVEMPGDSSAPRESAPPERALEQPRPPPDVSELPSYARARVEAMMQGPDGTHFQVPYLPRRRPLPPPPPPEAPPSPYEGVPVTGSFGIKDF